MAQQVGSIFLERTWDELTFYKMEGKYYVRKKSRLTREKVRTSPDFALTMLYANILGCASKIASSIYSDLPLHWRQFWMYQSFTGEAMKIIEAGHTMQDAYDYLWDTYVEYWVLYQKETGIILETGRKKHVKRTKTYKTRLKHSTSNPKRQHPNNSNRPWKRNWWQQVEERERKRFAYEKKIAKEAWLEAKQWQLLMQQVNQMIQQPAFAHVYD